MLAFALYCTLIVAVSLLGGWLPLKLRLTHRGMEIVISGVAGVMLGISLLHLVPHAAMELSTFQVGYGVLMGFLAMFFLERFFCFHHHDLPDADGGAASLPVLSHHDRAQDHAHDHSQCNHHVGPAMHSAHDLRWGGAAIGLSLHTLTEGVALGASMFGRGGRDSTVATTWDLLLSGFGIFLVIFLHKPFDALTLGTLMSRGKWPLVSQHAVNVAFALLVPAGGMLVYLAGAGLEHSQLVGWALAFSGGAFLCISLSDLLPELQFHQHDRWKLSLALLVGVLLAAGVAVAERQLHPRPGISSPQKIQRP